MNSFVETVKFRAVVAAAVFFALSATGAKAECTRDDAFNKMQVLGKANNERMLASSGKDYAEVKKTTDFAQEVAAVGKTLAAEKYGEACAAYDRIAAKYGVDMKTAAKGVVTMEEIRKDGGKRGGICSQADASKKMMGIVAKMQDKVAMGEAGQDELSAVLKETQAPGVLISTDPSEACKQLDAVAAKHALK